MNALTIVGRVTKDPEVKSNSDGSWCYLIVAVSTYKDKPSEFFNCKVRGKQAENCKKFVHKGDLVSVTGSVHLNQWGSNNEHAALAVNAASVEFYGKRSNYNEDDDAGRENTPVSSSKPTNNGWTQVDEEDLPF